jgi:hypothetical protein
MNWIFTRPGRIEFAKDEPYCFITPIGYRALDTLVPEITPMQEHPDIMAAYAEHRQLRLEFNDRLSKGDPETVRQGWQKWYFRGQTPAGDPGNPLHLSKMRLSPPRASERTEKSRP